MDKTIILKPSYLCNQDCVFCKARGIKANLSFEEIKARINLISDLGFSHVFLSGGEPTILEDFFSIINIIKEKGMFYSLATNMVLFSNKEFMERIKKNKPKFIFGSLYSLNKEIDENTTRSNTHEKRVEGLKNILKNNLDLVVNIVLSKSNLNFMQETIKKLNIMGVKKICISLVKSNGDGFIKKEFLPTDNEIEETLFESKKICKEKGIVLFLDNFPGDKQGYMSSLEYANITHALEPFENAPYALKEKARSKDKGMDIRLYKSLGLLRITKKCNQNCIFCNVMEKVGEKFYYSLPKISDELDRLKKEGVDGIIISGGEPTLNKNLDKVIALIKSKWFKEIHLQTNGLLFSYEQFMNLGIHKDVDFFLIPLYSHSAKISDALTRTPDSFELTLKGIRNLITEKRMVVINHVICSTNYKNLIDFCRFCYDKFGGEVLLSFSYLQPNGRAKGRKDLVPKMSDVAPYLNEALDFLAMKGVEFKLAEGCPPVCFVQKYKDFHGEFEKTTIRKKDYLTGINRLNKVKSEACKKCKYFDYCLGVWQYYSDMYGTDELKPID